MGEAETLEIPITKVQWGLRGAQIFFAFLSMCCIAAEIAWDNKVLTNMGSSILSNIHLFFIVLSMFAAAICVGIPYAYLNYGKFQSAYRAFRLPRIEFVHTAIWSILILIVSIALSVELGFRVCDPTSQHWYNNKINATAFRNDTTFINGLASNCRTARAGLAFGWFALGAWLASLAVVGKEWYDGRRQPLPKHDQHRDEITINTNSSRSSFEPSGTQPQYQEQVQMQNITSQPYSQPYSHQVPYSTPQATHTPMSGVLSQHASPIMTPQGMPLPEPQPIPTVPTGPTGPGVGFPQPQHYPPPQG